MTQELKNRASAYSFVLGIKNCKFSRSFSDTVVFPSTLELIGPSFYLALWILCQCYFLILFFLISLCLHLSKHGSICLFVLYSVVEVDIIAFNSLIISAFHLDLILEYACFEIAPRLHEMLWYVGLFSQQKIGVSGTPGHETRIYIQMFKLLLS